MYFDFNIQLDIYIPSMVQNEVKHPHIYRSLQPCTEEDTNFLEQLQYYRWDQAYINFTFGHLGQLAEMCQNMY